MRTIEFLSFDPVSVSNSGVSTPASPPGSLAACAKSSLAIAMSADPRDSLVSIRTRVTGISAVRSSAAMKFAVKVLPTCDRGATISMKEYRSESAGGGLVLVLIGHPRFDTADCSAFDQAPGSAADRAGSHRR